MTTKLVAITTGEPGCSPVAYGAVEFQVRTVLGDSSDRGMAFAGRAEDYAGEYRGSGATRGMVLTVAADSTGALTLRSGDGRPSRLTYFGGETFGRGESRYTFVREDGRVTGMRIDGGTTIGTATRQAASAR